MSEAHRLPRRRRLPRRIIPVGIALAVALAVAVPGVAAALFSSSPSAQTASVTAATIGAPTNFKATATGSATANLTWTAPSPPLNGYMLSQSPGTAQGSCATLSASSTSCTASGLSQGTVYTWTLQAVYNSWQSSSTTAGTTTFRTVAATLLTKATDGTSGTQTDTLSGVTTTNGATLLILAYRQGSDGNLAISSITGTAVSSTPPPASINSEPFSVGSSHFAVLAWQATGAGTSGGTVIVKFSKANNVTTTIDVVQLSGNNTSASLNSAVSTNTGTTVTGGSLSPGSSSDGEVFFAGLTSSTTMSTPSGYTALDAAGSTVHGSWFNSSASSAGVSTTLGASATWGTIEVEISHA